MSKTCPNCGSSNIIFDVDAGQLVCTSCGTAEISPLLVPDTHPRQGEHVFRTPHIPHNFPDVSYKGTQNLVKGAEWHIQNHLREHRSMIHNLCTQLEFQGAGRAIYLFELAMAKGEYRWGNDARLVSSVSVAISMTEQNKIDVIPRISSLMHENVSTVLRMWIRVLNTLDMQLYSTSPLLVVAAVYASLQEALEQPDVLPRAVQSLISPLSISIEPVMALAEQLSLFFSHSGYFVGLPAAATACAIFIVAIETEYGQALPISVVNSLANYLGDKVAAGTVYTIVERRKAMIIILNEYACLLPWISIPTGILWNHQRSSAVLRALPDVLSFQRELEELRRTECVETSSHLKLENIDGSQTVEAEALASVPMPPSTHTWTMTGNRKRPKGAQQAQRIISQLLDPTSSTLPLVDGTADAEAIQERLARIELQVLFGASEPLTRLQALSLQRGGEENIDDDELFESGELEGYKNSEETARLLGDSHPEWNIAMKADSMNQGKRSKADTIPKDIRYSDDEEGGSVADREYGNRGNGAHADPEREAENYPLDRDAYLAFGILADYDGTDADTARYFGSNMEQF